MPIACRTPTAGSMASGAAFTITLPTSTAVGDLLFVFVSNVATTGPAAPSGWTQATGSPWSSGSAQSLSIFYAQYSASLTLNFTNSAGAGVWACNSYFQAGATLYLDGNAVATNNSTNNTTLAVGAPTSTGNVAGDYEIIALGWGSTTNIGSAPGGVTRDIAGNLSNSASMALYHMTAAMGANATATAWSFTLSGNTSRKTGVGLLLMAVPDPTTALGISDSFDTGSLNTGLWTSFGVGQSMQPTYLQVAPLASQSAGSYGGVISAASYNLTGAYCMIQFRTWLAATAGNVQTIQCQIDSNNYLEFGQIDTNMVARRNVAGVNTTQNSVALPTAPVWLRMHESGGVCYWMYSTNNRVTWTMFSRFPNPIAVTAIFVDIISGTYASVASPGIATWNYLNYIPPNYRNLTGTSNGSSSVVTLAPTRRRSLTGTSPGVSVASATIAKYVSKYLTVSATYPPQGLSAASGLLARATDQTRPIYIAQFAEAIVYDGAEIVATFPSLASPGNSIFAALITGPIPGHANTGTPNLSSGQVWKNGANVGSIGGGVNSSVSPGGRQYRSGILALTPTVVGNSVRYFFTGGTNGYMRLAIFEIAGAAAPFGFLNSASPGGTFAQARPNTSYKTQLVFAIVFTDQTASGSTLIEQYPGWTQPSIYSDGTLHIPSSIQYILGWTATRNLTGGVLGQLNLTASTYNSEGTVGVEGPAPGLIGTAPGYGWAPRLVATGTPPTFRNTILIGQSNGQATCVGQPSSRRRNISLAAISDNFDAGTLDPKWSASLVSAATQDVTGATLNQTPASSTAGSSAGVIATNYFDMRMKTIVVEVNQTPSRVSGVRMVMKLEASGSAVYYEYGLVDGNLTVLQSGGNLGGIAWPTGLRALRIVVDGFANATYPNYYFDYSIDGVSWIQAYPNPIGAIAYTNLANAKISLTTTTTTSVASPGTGKWDNLNIQPFPWVSYKSLIGFSVGQSLGGNYNKSVLADSPIAYWRLGETAGLTAADASGRGHTGTYASTGVTLNQPSSLAGDADPSVLFAGTSGASGSVLVPAHADWRPVGGGGWSMEAWVNPGALSGTQEIIRLGGGDGWFMRLSGNQVGSLWPFPSGVFITPQGGNLSAANVWAHVAATYDGAFVRHYVNGKIVFSQAETRIFTPTYTGNLGLACQDPSTGGEFFLGSLDEIAIYNYALSPGQISAHYTAGLNTPTPLTKGAAKIDIVGLSAGAATENGQPSAKRLLTGTSNGTATEVGDPSRYRRILATSAGVATVSVTIVKRPSLFGTSTGAATDAGQPSRRRSLVVASVGQAAVTATISKTLPSINTAGGKGVATVSAQLTVRRVVVGLSAGAATEAGQPSVKRLLTGTSSGVAAEVGQPTRRRSLVVVSAGVSTVSGQIIAKRALYANATGVATADAQVLIRSSTIPPVTIHGVATVSGFIGRKRQITAASVGTSAASAVLKAKRALVANSSGVAVTGATIQRERPLIGSAAGVASANAPIIQRYRFLTGEADGVTIISTPLLLRKRVLVGTSRGSSSIASTLRTKKAVRGTTNGRSTCNGRVINISLTLWNGSTFVLVGNYPVVLWDQAEFELQVEEGESDVDYVAYKLSTDQFNPVQP